MAVIGVASIRVKPDLSVFRKELTAGLKAIKNELTIRVKADVDTTKANLQMDRLVQKFDGKNINLKPDIDRTALSRVKSALASLGRGGAAFLGLAGATGLSATTSLAKLALVAGALASTLSALATIVGGLGQALFQVGVAAGGVAVAGLAAVAVVGATVKFAMKGVGDAFSALADGDAKKLQEALKKLSPEARKFVQALGELRPEFEKIRQQVQSNIFADLAKSAKETGQKLLPIFSKTALEIGSTINTVLKDVFKVLRDPGTLSSLGEIGKSISDGFRSASGAVKPLLSAILDITKSATSLLPKLGEGLTSVSQKFADFIKAKSASGELTRFFENGIEKAKQFGRVIRDFGVGISNVFKIGSGSTGGFLDILERVSSKFRAFTESVQGKEVLGSIFDGIQSLAKAFGRFLKALEPLLPLVGDLAQLLGDVLGQVLDALGPILKDVGKVLIQTLLKILPDLLPIVVHLAQALGDILVAVLPLAKPFVKILEAIEPLIEPITRLVQALIPPLTKLLEFLVVPIEAVAKALGFLVTVLSKVVDGIDNVFSGFGELFKGGLMNVGPNLFALMDGSLVKASQARGGELLKGLKDGILLAIANTKGAAPAAFDAALALTGGYIDGFENGQVTVQNKVQRMVDSILNLMGVGPAKKAEADGRAISEHLSNGMLGNLPNILATVQRIVNAITGLFNGSSAAYDRAGRNIADSLNGGLASESQTIASTVSRVSSGIRAVFGGTSLFSEGAAIMNGLIAGVNSRRNVLVSIMHEITALVAANKGPIEKDRVLLKPAGIAIMEGLLKGIQIGWKPVMDELQDMTILLGDQFTMGLQAQASFASDEFDPNPVVVNVDLNRQLLQDFVQVEIGENNRVTRRQIVGGVLA